VAYRSRRSAAVVSPIAEVEAALQRQVPGQGAQGVASRKSAVSTFVASRRPGLFALWRGRIVQERQRGDYVARRKAYAMCSLYIISICHLSV
jgi:hypothetical protein